MELNEVYYDQLVINCNALTIYANIIKKTRVTSLVLTFALRRSE